MPIPISFNIKKTTKAVSLDALKDIRSESIACWYCGVYKNTKSSWQPSVLVGFRKMQSGNMSDDMDMRRIPITAMGQVELGTIWANGVCSAKADYEVHDFDIDFRPSGWSLASAYESFENNTAPPFPRNIYPLRYDRDKNWLIKFRLPSGGKLLIPCLEFFSRCYGRSQELNRILTTFPWMGSSEAHRSKLYAPIDEPEEPNKWKVKLRQRLTNGDTVFLAHAKYDPYTEKIAKSIYAQIESSYTPDSIAPIFLKIPPWFQGPAEIRARGIWFDNNRSFLALQVIGCSDPDGILIVRGRDNSHKREGIAPEADGEAWAGATKKVLVRPPDIVDLTGDLEPDHETSRAEILDADFLVMGVPRTVVDHNGKKVTDSSGIQRNGNCASVFSSGCQHGSGKGVGHACIHAKPIMESHGALMDMWNAVQHLKIANPSIIKHVEWFTFEDGYKSTSLPNLIALDPREEFKGRNLPIETRHWPYYDVGTSTARGILVICMTVHGKRIHIIEIQRRPRVKLDRDGNKCIAEESFQGFVILFRDETQSIRQLTKLMSDICYVRGIVKKLTHTIDKADTFIHKTSGYEAVPCEAAVRKALSNVGVIL